MCMKCATKPDEQAAGFGSPSFIPLGTPGIRNIVDCVDDAFDCRLRLLQIESLFLGILLLEKQPFLTKLGRLDCQQLSQRISVVKDLGWVTVGTAVGFGRLTFCVLTHL